MFSLPQGVVLRHKKGHDAASLPYTTEDVLGPTRLANATDLATALQEGHASKVRRVHDRIAAGSSCLACQKAKRKCDGQVSAPNAAFRDRSNAHS